MAKSNSNKPEVIVGTLNDWPLGARLGSLLGLPEEATRVACFQAIGNHGDAASKVFFKRKETVSRTLAPFSDALVAALETCTCDKSKGIKAQWGFHGSAPVDEVKEDLSASFVVRTPIEAREARRLSPKVSLARIEKALEKAPARVQNKKSLMAFLEGGPFKESLLEIDGRDLGYGFVAWPDAFGEVDTRLGFLWAAIASEASTVPMPPFSPELGFDRFDAHVQLLKSAGVDANAAHDLVLVKNAASSRWWPSTGVRVWEQLRVDPKAFVDRVVGQWMGERHLADVLISMLWLPGSVVAHGAIDLLREVCSSPALVPDNTLKKMKEEDDQTRAFIASLKRKHEAARPKTMEPSSRVAGSFLPSLTAEDAKRALAKLMGTTAGGAQAPAKTTKPAKAKSSIKS